MNSHSSDGRLPLLRRVRYRITETPVRMPVVWLRHRGFGSADVFLTCYPKSGSTWLRFYRAEEDSSALMNPTAPPTARWFTSCATYATLSSPASRESG